MNRRRSRPCGRVGHGLGRGFGRLIMPAALRAPAGDVVHLRGLPGNNNLRSGSPAASSTDRPTDRGRGMDNRPGFGRPLPTSFFTPLRLEHTARRAPVFCANWRRSFSPPARNAPGELGKDISGKKGQGAADGLDER